MRFKIEIKNKNKNKKGLTNTITFDIIKSSKERKKQEMRKAYEIRTANNEVLIATNNYQLFDYCNEHFNVIEQGASTINYIVVDGYKWPQLKKEVATTIKEMLKMEF